MEGKTKTTGMDKNMAPDHQNGFPPVHKKKKSANLFKAGLYLLRTKSRKSSIPKSKSSSQIDHHDVGCSKFSWKSLVGSMRPMHLQGHRTPPKPANTAPFCPIVNESPSAISLSSYGSVSDMSSYGSVNDMSQYGSPLSVLPEVPVVKSGQTTFWCGDDEDDTGDEMIDAKAEEFIAQFYKTMRLQNMNC